MRVFERNPVDDDEKLSSYAASSNRMWNVRAWLIPFGHESVRIVPSVRLSGLLWSCAFVAYSYLA